MKSRKFQALIVLAAGALLGAAAASGMFPLGQSAQAAPGDGAAGGVEKIISFEVRLPTGALLEIDGNKTTSTGETRQFETPPLRVGGHYDYTLKATVDGKEVTRKIHLTHGADNTFDLRAEFRPAGAGRSESARITEGGQQDPKTATPTGKGKRAQEFIAAFNKGDAKAVAAFWTEDASYVDMDGHESKGRPAIQKLYEKVFAEGKGATLKIFVISVKQLSPDVGLEEGITEVTPAEGGPGSAARFSAVLVKKDGEWYFESVHESLASPPSNAEHFDDIDWLLGSWTTEAEKGKGEAMKASYSWAENKNFIVSSFATTLNDVPVTGGTQWIAWDAVDKRIRSWTFYSGGGIGEAVWTKDGDKWSVATTARTAAGKKVSATNVITKVDADHATWQMTKLTVDGEAKPDPKPMNMKRVKP